MAGSLFGLGAGTPTRFPYAGRPQPAPGVGPGASNVVRARIVIVGGTAGGVFVYNGAPGVGNLIASVTNAAADPFGNPTKPEIAVYATSGTSFLQMLAGNPALLNVGTGDIAEATPAQFNARVVGSGATRYILSDIRAPRVAGEAALAIGEIQLFSPTADLSIPAGINLIANDGAGNQAFVQVKPTGTTVVQGPFTSTAGTAAVPSVVETDVWNAMALNAGFAAGVPAPQFKLMPDQTVMCRGIVTLSANQAANTVFTTLGANYVAAHGTQFATRNTLSGYAAGNGSVANAGGASTLAIVVAGVTGNVVQLDGVRYSTDT